MFWITEYHLLFVGLFDWGNAETQTSSVSEIVMVMHWRNPELENLVLSHP